MPIGRHVHPVSAGVVIPWIFTALTLLSRVSWHVREENPVVDRILMFIQINKFVGRIIDLRCFSFDLSVPWVFASIHVIAGRIAAFAQKEGLFVHFRFVCRAMVARDRFYIGK